ncbi:MAG TPA: hypothetical protein VF401_02765 [Candidatus Saccharimonadales bacterium]
MSERAKELFSFEPIIDEITCRQALSYIATESAALAETALGQILPLDTVTVFAQSDAEYETVEAFVRQQGPLSPYSHGATTYVETNLNIEGRAIQLLGVRKPDSTRKERGYGDYPVHNFEVIKAQTKGNPYVYEMKSGNDIELLELRHPDFDVRGYIVEAEGG